MSKTKKILIIEDDTFIKEVFEKKFADYPDLELETVSTGEEGCEKAEQETKDIILVDLLLPDINGLEVIRKLNKKIDRDRTKIMVITNVSFKDSLNDAMEEGVSDYFIKTTEDFMAIVQMIKTYLDNE